MVNTEPTKSQKSSFKGNITIKIDVLNRQWNRGEIKDNMYLREMTKLLEQFAEYCV